MRRDASNLHLQPTLSHEHPLDRSTPEHPAFAEPTATRIEASSLRITAPDRLAALRPQVARALDAPLQLQPSRATRARHRAVPLSAAFSARGRYAKDL
jgi:hypothetical protein